MISHIKAFKWSFFEKILSQGTQLAVILVLSKILGPEEFGLIALSALTISIGSIISDGGIYNALVRNKKPKDIEYSTAFYINMALAILVFLIIWTISEVLSSFYGEPELALVLPLLALSIPINASSIVQRAIINIGLDFKKLARITLVSSIIAGGVGIFMANKGFGVWSLVAQTLIQAAVSTTFLWLNSSWRPISGFNISTCKKLFKYGANIGLSSIIDVLYSNLVLMIIGKLYTSRDVGVFFQAKRFIEIPTNTFVSIIQRVNLPAMAQCENKVVLQKIFGDSVIFATILYALCIGVYTIASEVIFDFILGEEWKGISQISNIFAISFLFYPFHTFTLNLLQVEGRSDLFLKLEIVKKITGLVGVVVSYKFGVQALAISVAFNSFISVFINGWFTKKAIPDISLNPLKDCLLISSVTLFSILVPKKIFFQFGIEVNIIYDIVIFLLCYSSIISVFYAKNIYILIRRLGA